MRVGDVVGGRFLLESIAGKGGMGVVFRALDQKNNLPVALKALLHMSEEGEQRFLREAEILSALHSPGVVQYITHGESEEGIPYLVMEWLEGESLAARLERLPLSPSEALLVATRAAEALTETHRKGVIHRDIKPSNLFLVEKKPSKVKILDFGIARPAAMVGDVTRAGVLLGSPGYIAPEQARGEKELDARADVFSLGTVLFECLAGQPPFVASHAVAILIKILFEEAPLLRTLRPNLPESLERLVSKMMAKNRDERFADGAETARALSAFEGFDNEATAMVSLAPTALTNSEQRLLGVVLLSKVFAPTQEASPTQAMKTVPIEHLDEVPTRAVDANEAMNDAQLLLSLRNRVSRFSARVEPLADGSLVATLLSTGEAIDQAAQAARCAQELRRALPKAEAALALGRGTIKPWPIGEVIERAATLLQSMQKTLGQRRTKPPTDQLPIVIDEATAALLKHRFEVHNESGLFFLGEERAAEIGARTLLGRPSPCVGREGELAFLRATFSACVEQSKPRAVLVTAPAGTGKSRLRYELTKSLSAFLLLGKGDPVRLGAPFSMIAQALRQASNIQEGDSPQERHRKLVALVTRRSETAQRIDAYPQSRRFADFLGELACAPVTSAPSLPLSAARQDPQLMGDQMRRAFLDWLRLECSLQPIVLILEDLHWGDLPTVKLIEAALQDLQDLPLMVLALARPEVKEVFPGLWQEHNVEEIVLRGLPRQACERFIRRMLGEEVTPEAASQMIDRAGGNAFYLEELIRAVHEGRGDVLPETVLAMAQARVEALPERARQILRAASIFGESFSRVALSFLLRGAVSSDEIERTLRSLVEQEVLTRSVSQEARYHFRHGLMRDAAYAMLTSQDRALGHRLAAQWLEAQGAPEAKTLAEHFELGGEPEKAAVWWAASAREAHRASDLHAVIARVERAVSCGIPDTERASLRLLQAEAYGWLGEARAAVPHWQDAVAKAPHGGVLWYHASAGLFMVSLQLRDFERALEITQELQKENPKQEAEAASSMANAIVVSFACVGGLYPIAESFLEKLNLSTPPPMESADASITLGWRNQSYSYGAFYLKGDPWEYLQRATAGLRHFENAGHVRGAASQAVEIGRAYLNLGAFLKAERFLRDWLVQIQRYQIHYLSPFAKLFLGQVLRCRGVFEEAKTLMEIALSEFERTGHGPKQGDTRVELARLFLEQNQPKVAEELLEKAIEILAFVLPNRAKALAAMAFARLSLNNLSGALEAAKEAREGLEALGDRGYEEGYIRLAYIEALFANKEQRAAKSALFDAKERLLSQAQKIPDPAFRESFLYSVPENKQLLALAERYGV